jgi:hypothetical protein
MISIGKKLFEEVDTPTGIKVIDEDKVSRIVQRESSWVGLFVFLLQNCVHYKMRNFSRGDGKD